MSKIGNWLKYFWHSLFIGMKATDDAIFSGNTDALPGTAIIQEVNDHRVSKALLKGEVTQEVEELRYRTYKVDREAKTYEYIAPTLAFKREKNDSKFVTYENSDNLEVITIQPNDVNVDGVCDGVDNIEIGEVKVLNEQGDFVAKIDKMRENKKHLIEITRSSDFYPRYRIEEYCKKLVVKKIPDDNHAILDFYFSVYPDDKDIKSKGFVREIEKIRDNKIKSDIIDIEKVHFVTSHAFKLDDMLEFEFDNLRFKEILEFDGHYIVKFRCRILKNAIDLTDQFYSESMDKKYKEKAKKDVVYDITGIPPTKKYVCEHCGKEIIYDAIEMDEQMISKPRDIDDVIENYDSVSEYLDAEISQATYGVTLCKDCLKKYLIEHKLM